MKPLTKEEVQNLTLLDIGVNDRARVLALLNERDALAGQVAALREALRGLCDQVRDGAKILDTLEARTTLMHTEAAAREHDARVWDAAIDAVAAHLSRDDVTWDTYAELVEVVCALKKGGTK